MKRTFAVLFIIFTFLHIDEVQARSLSILTGTVSEFYRRTLMVRNSDGEVLRLRIGRRTVYPDGVPAVGDKVKVEYSIVRGIYVGYSVMLLKNAKKESPPRKEVAEAGSLSSSSLPAGVAAFAGKWEGSWDSQKDYAFTLAISHFDLKLEVAEVRYESKDMQFSEKANVISGEKPRIEWMINSIVKPGSPFASPSKGYFDIITESMPIYYAIEIQNDKTLKATFDSQRMTALGTSRMAVLRRVN